jgi:hypothetical protein
VNPEPEMFTLDDVLDEKDARSAARKASTVGALAEQEYIRATGALADAEREYRRALAAEVVRLHSTGVAWTVCSDLARGDTNVSELRHARDVAKGVVDVGKQRGFRLAADRRSLDALTEWSMKQTLSLSPPAQEPTHAPFGRRAA